MLKKLVVAAVLLLLALVVYNYVTTGKIAFIPTATLSEEERQIDDLVDQVRQAVRQAAQAGRSAGLAGVDTTHDVQAAQERLRAIQARAKELGRTVKGEAAKRLERLQAEIDQAKRELGVR